MPEPGKNVVCPLLPKTGKWRVLIRPVFSLARTLTHLPGAIHLTVGKGGIKNEQSSYGGNVPCLWKLFPDGATGIRRKIHTPLQDIRVHELL